MKDFLVIDNQNNLVKCVDNIVQVKIFLSLKWQDLGFFTGNNYCLGSVYRLDMTRNGFSKHNAWGISTAVLYRMSDEGKIIINTMEGLFCIMKREIFNRPSNLRTSTPGKLEQYVIPQSLMKQIGSKFVRY